MLSNDFVWCYEYNNFELYVKIQEQIYHSAGSLLPFTNADHNFLQIYFIEKSSDQVIERGEINKANKREIDESLQQLFLGHNQFNKLFKTAIELMPFDDYRIVIRADKTSVGEHTRRFKVPIIDELAIVGEQFESRDIVLHHQNNRFADTHRSYDVLQQRFSTCGTRTRGGCVKSKLLMAETRKI
ncbi:hypothetical protein AVEN_91934-1 [Araneus ventricosus]|uniref:Helitron helicase-like domain-containing protein n=1 Tax=Araneus ventricosus TaxID=182803 RepID=A0A4Y2JD47_ARAVE|nr:hypothetical protein AVEN_91934-1 [Araneus ventricosus]